MIHSMKLGFFTSIEGWGGSESYLQSLMLGVRDAGHEVVLFGVEGTRLMREMGQAGVECVAWRTPSERKAGESRRSGGGGGTGVGAMSRSSSSSATKWRLLSLAPPWAKLLVGSGKEVLHLSRVFCRHRVDVLHVSVSGYEVAGFACRLSGIPSVGMYVTTPTPEEWAFRRFLLRHTARSYKYFLFQTQFCLDAWVQAAHLGNRPRSFVWNGIDTSRFSQRTTAPRRSSAEPFRLISMGRLHPMKGFRYLIEAVRLAEHAIVSLDILGNGDEEQALKALVSQSGLDNRIFFRGHVENPVDRLREADCFVLASTCLESCPGVLPEAMACGLPLITSDFGPLQEVNVHGVTGLVVPTTDSQALALAIRRLADDPELCQRMGRAGRERAVKHFSREQMITRILAIYRSLVEHRA